uniref:Uncharacterized protein n=1 Tax=Heterorhabditis bacteriophora TaxID=37862 RepID=A0A1I7W9L3_HETBA
MCISSRILSVGISSLARNSWVAVTLEQHCLTGGHPYDSEATELEVGEDYEDSRELQYKGSTMSELINVAKHINSN